MWKGHAGWKLLPTTREKQPLPPPQLYWAHLAVLQRAVALLPLLGGILQDVKGPLVHPSRIKVNPRFY